MSRSKLNRSGEPLEGGKTPATMKVLRRIRRRASNMGITLRNFIQIYGMESDLGPEYAAHAVRWPSLAVLVWHPIGDDLVEEARRTCDEIIEVVDDPEFPKSKSIYGISWAGRWPQKAPRP